MSGGVLEVGSSGPYSWTRNRTESHSFWLVYTFGSGKRLIYPRLLTADKNWVHYFSTSDKVEISEIVPPSISHTEIFQEFFDSGRGQDFCHLVLWRIDYYEWDVELGKSELCRLIEDSDKSKEVFKMTPSLQESKRNLVQHDTAR